MTNRGWRIGSGLASAATAALLWINGCTATALKNDEPVAVATGALGTPGTLSLMKRGVYPEPASVLQLAADRLEYGLYPLYDDIHDAKCPKDGVDYYHKDFAFAYLTGGTPTLKVNLAQLPEYNTHAGVGDIVAEDTWSTDGTGIKKIAVAGLDGRLFAVATRNNDDTVTIRVFEATRPLMDPDPAATVPLATLATLGPLDPTGRPTGPLATYTSVNDPLVGKVTDLAIARVPVSNVHSLPNPMPKAGLWDVDRPVIELVMVSTAASNQTLQVTSFSIDHVSGGISRQKTQAGPAVTKVAIAVPGRPYGAFVPAYVTTGSGGRVAAWSVDDQGTLYQNSEVSLGASQYADITATGAGYRRVAVYGKAINPTVATTLQTFDVGPNGPTSLVKRSELNDSSPLSGASLVSGGSSRLFLTGRIGNTQVVRSYLSVTDLQSLDETSDSSQTVVANIGAAAVVESDWLVSMGVNTTGALLTSWHDSYLPVAKGFWPPNKTRVQDSVSSGDKQASFGFDPLRLGQDADWSIAASDQFVVVGGESYLRFFDKAGNQLPAKYEPGPGEYDGTSPIFMTTDDGTGLFDTAVGVPSGPSAEGSLLRHLRLQDACDPELPKEERNPCPTHAFDGMVTFDASIHKFVIAGQFENDGGCNEVNARYPGLAVSKTDDPRDGFYVYASLEGIGHDMERVAAQSGLALYTWHGKSPTHNLAPNILAFELADLSPTPALLPRVHKIDMWEIEASGDQPPVVARGVPLGMILKQFDIPQLADMNEDFKGDDSNATITLNAFKKTTLGPMSTKKLTVAAPFHLYDGAPGNNMPVAVFKSVGPAGPTLYEGHLYLAGTSAARDYLRAADYTLRWDPSSNNLWLAGTSAQEFPCLDPTLGTAGFTCVVYGVSVDDLGRMALSYSSAGDAGDPNGHTAASYAILQRMLAPPVTGKYGAGSTNDFPRVDFAVPAADPGSLGFWNIAASSSGPYALRAVAPAMPAYKGIGRLWPVSSTKAPATLPTTYQWQKQDWSSTYKQIVHGDFDGDTVEDLFAYNDTEHKGTFYKVSGTGVTQIGPDVTGLSSSMYFVPLEMCGTTGQRCPGNFANNTRELLGYDWTTGVATLWQVSGSAPSLLNISTFNTRKTWTIIEQGEYTSDPGDELVFYDPTVGEFWFTELTSSGQFVNSWSKTPPNIGGYATDIVAGNWDANNTGDELYVYTPVQAMGRFYDIDSGVMTQVGDDQRTRSTFTQTAVMSNGWNILVQYDPTLEPGTPSNATEQGTIRFTKVTNGVPGTPYEVPLTRFDNGRDWNMMMAAKFRSTSAQDLLFYRNIAPHQ